MKCITYICLAATLVLSLSAQAQSKRKTSATKPTSTTTDLPPRVVSDSEYSYAKGVTHTEGLGYYLLNQYQLGETKNPIVAKAMQFYFALPPEYVPMNLAYSAGLEIGQRLGGEQLAHFNEMITGKADSTYIDRAAFEQGFEQQMTANARMTPEQARQLLAHQDRYFGLLKAKAAYDELQAYQATHKDLKMLDGGVLYRVVTKGKGARPKATSRVKVNYEGRLMDGKVFDSSYKRGEPIVFAANQVIKGWTTALQAMPVGSTWEVVIPQELAYGERGAGQDIPPSLMRSPVWRSIWSCVPRTP